jgi:hypothetical protein
MAASGLLHPVRIGQKAPSLVLQEEHADPASRE